MGAVLVHIDLDGERPHPSSLAALTAGRAVASSWGGTLYAAIVIHDPSEHGSPDTTGQISTTRIASVEATRVALARGGADKVVVAITDTPIAPLWAAIGGAWQGVLDHLRPRLVLFGADAPSAAELGPRTGARIGARLLGRARAVGLDHVELRDRDGGYVRATDGGAAVVMIGAAAATGLGDEDIDVVVLTMPGGADDRIELAGSAPAELVHDCGTLIAIDEEIANDAHTRALATRLAALLGATLVGSPGAVRSGAITSGAVVERTTPLAPELCIAIGAPGFDLAGAASLVRIGANGGKPDGALAAPIPKALEDLVHALEAES
ncbi:MAG: hypothetical protein ABI867_38125 [Kofleriaceae bacterium]